jgi:hypothetical protein
MLGLDPSMTATHLARAEVTAGRRSDDTKANIISL